MAAKICGHSPWPTWGRNTRSFPTELCIGVAGKKQDQWDFYLQTMLAWGGGGGGGGGVGWVGGTFGRSAEKASTSAAGLKFV